ncbi:hypothetical protein [Polynucleobacter sp.]|uniref:hypothetical protein n=1 Tax=Polynucleobacter sp. TaxID=2029855 RepID=UPI003F69B12E
MTEKEKKLREILGMAIGEASMCWEPIPAGVFDSEKAVIVLENLFLELIKAFPQILADNAFDGIPNAETLNDFGGHLYSMSEQKKHIQVFIREVVNE